MKTYQERVKELAAGKRFDLDPADCMAIEKWMNLYQEMEAENTELRELLEESLPFVGRCLSCTQPIYVRNQASDMQEKIKTALKI